MKTTSAQFSFNYAWLAVTAVVAEFSRLLADFIFMIISLAVAFWNAPCSALSVSNQNSRGESEGGANTMKRRTMAVLFCGILAAVDLTTVQAFAGGPFRPGTGPRFRSVPNDISRTSLEAEMQFRGSGIKEEAEVKFNQLTKSDVTTTMLSAEVTVIVPKGATPLDATMLDAEIIVDSGGDGVNCSFSNDPSIRQIVRGSETLQVVTFRGSTAQMNIDPSLDKGLHCTAIPLNVVAGETATVVFTNFPTPVPPLVGEFAFHR